jgi:hypothetical protein
MKLAGERLTSIGTTSTTCWCSSRVTASVEPEPDTHGRTPTLEFDVPVGRTVFVDAGVRPAVNTGKKAYYEILIELKDEHTV